MPDGPIAGQPTQTHRGGGTAPGGNGLTMDQGAARLAPFGTPAAPRPERGSPGERLSLRPADPGPEIRPDPDLPPDLRPEPEADQPEPEQAEAQPLQPDTVLWAAPDGAPVTLEEARQGYLRGEDYHRKVGLVAEGRRQLEGQYAEMSADREAVAQFILRSLPDLSPERIAREQMSGEQVWRLQQESQQLVGFVQQLRQQTAQQRQQLEAQEVEQARAMAPEVIPGWHDPKVMEAEIQATRAYLDRAGVPPTSQAKLARDPWLAKLAVDAAKFAQVRLGADRGRQSQQRAVSPHLPAQDQAPPGSGGRREQLRQLAGGQRAGSMRQRTAAAAELLRGVPVRR